MYQRPSITLISKLETPADKLQRLRFQLDILSEKSGQLPRQVCLPNVTTGWGRLYQLCQWQCLLHWKEYPKGPSEIRDSGVMPQHPNFCPLLWNDVHGPWGASRLEFLVRRGRKPCKTFTKCLILADKINRVSSDLTDVPHPKEYQGEWDEVLCFYSKGPRTIR